MYVSMLQCINILFQHFRLYKGLRTEQEKDSSVYRANPAALLKTDVKLLLVSDGEISHNSQTKSYVHGVRQKRH